MKGNGKKCTDAQLDNYQSAGMTEALWMSAYFAQSFMYEKNPGPTGRGTWQDVLKPSVHAL